MFWKNARIGIWRQFRSLQNTINNNLNNTQFIKHWFFKHFIYTYTYFIINYIKNSLLICLLSKKTCIVHLIIDRQFALKRHTFWHFISFLFQVVFFYLFLIHFLYNLQFIVVFSYLVRFYSARPSVFFERNPSIL